MSAVSKVKINRPEAESDDFSAQRRRGVLPDDQTHRCGWPCQGRSRHVPQLAQRALTFNGSAYGNRTRLSALRGPCPEPIDERAQREVMLLNMVWMSMTGRGSAGSLPAGQRASLPASSSR